MAGSDQRGRWGRGQNLIGDDALKIELDRNALFALASDTRLEILKALQSERRTLAQLTEHLGVDKSAVHRHLRKLEEGDFVKKTDEHGFVYYSLTWKARDLVSPGDNTRIVVLLSSTLVLLVLISFLLTVASTDVSRVGEASDNFTVGSDQVQDQVRYPIYVISIVVLVVAVLTAYLAMGLLRRPRQSGAGEVENRIVPDEPKAMDDD
jgi:DNA-binding transcriptional ArsR family regulator